MPFTPSGKFSTDYLISLLLSQCESVRDALEVADAEAALEKIATYTAENMAPPRILVEESEVEFRTDDHGQRIGEVVDRNIKLGFWLRVPDAAEFVGDLNLQQQWCNYQLDLIDTEIRALGGTGEVVPGKTHVVMHSPRLIKPWLDEFDDTPEYADPDDEVDYDDSDTPPVIAEERPIWCAILFYQLGWG
ncbi:hypothetical protein [Aporhodopirellula aestuarii]|uniref:Uncharacterized protein n=1 Tax=Aporhodopirellula aestuarii TaxID=2950107 RepID=A0ABT0UAV9_9BACT|nr:hypothetical protein [Aporhodopirellula aestuarii]MCM2373911.1 hypothetical protein [Aporhodopirellula aestuarii]